MTMSTPVLPLVALATSVANDVAATLVLGFNFQFPPISGFRPSATMLSLKDVTLDNMENTKTNTTAICIILHEQWSQREKLEVAL